MSDSRFSIGPGNIDVCLRCQEHLKHDVDHIIADELEKMCLPSEIVNGCNVWQKVIDLLRLRRGQRGTSPGGEEADPAGSSHARKQDETQEGLFNNFGAPCGGV